MKKLSSLLAVVLLFNICLSFSSCANEEYAVPSVTTYHLTAENFTDYLAVNITYDYNVVHTGYDSSGKDHYDIYCNVTISTSPKCNFRGDYIFNGASVTYIYNPIGMFDWTRPSTLTNTISVDIGRDGYSEATFVMFLQDTTTINAYTFESTNQDQNLKYVNVSGTVIFPITRDYPA
ncbi:MAG: hypothetical protein E7645_07980 [Ruminococcaceae bacterium]|nr:hypothetical protein [Oscillospiraceae bacterium]